MPSDPRIIRASDQDRDRVAALLREHHAVGRLDAAEFHERLDKVYEARTLGDLEDLTADLPAIDPYPLPSASLPRTAQRHESTAGSAIDAFGHGGLSAGWRAAWGSWFTVTLLSVVIWLLTGAGYPWPLWVALPLGAVLAGRAISGTGPHGGGPHGRRARAGRDRRRRREIGGP